MVCFNEYVTNSSNSNGNSSDGSGSNNKKIHTSQIPLNCPAAALRQVFVCESPPVVLHYQAMSYVNNFTSIGFYPLEWEKYQGMEWSEI